MNDLQTYLLEELKQSDQKLRSLDELQMSLIKFYFTTAFSLATVVIGLYNFGIATDLKQSLAWFLLLPSFTLGFVTNYALGRILIEYEHWETTRHQVNNYFVHGEIKKTYQLFNSPLKAFRTLVSWMATLTLFAFIYFAIPFFQKTTITVGVSILLALAITGIISSVILASLNAARRKGRDAVRKAHMSQLRVALELYYDQHQSYPVQAEYGPIPEVLGEFLPSIPSDPEEGCQYTYHSDAEGSTYNLRYILSEGGEQILTPNQ